MRDNPTVRRRRITLICEYDSIGIILARAILPALEDRGVARVAHEWELEERAGGTVGEVEAWRAVEEPFDRVEGGLRPVFELVRVGVFAWCGVSRWIGRGTGGEERRGRGMRRESMRGLNSRGEGGGGTGELPW